MKTVVYFLGWAEKDPCANFTIILFTSGPKLGVILSPKWMFGNVWNYLGYNN